MSTKNTVVIRSYYYTAEIELNSIVYCIAFLSYFCSGMTCMLTLEGSIYGIKLQFHLCVGNKLWGRDRDFLNLLLTHKIE